MKEQSESNYHRSQFTLGENPGLASYKRVLPDSKNDVKHVDDFPDDVLPLVDTRETEITLRSRAELMLENSRWASEIFRQYDRETTMHIASEVAKAAEEKAEHYANWAVSETGFGVVADKTLKNQLASAGVFRHFESEDFINPVMDRHGVVHIPQPAGVIFALTPSTNPVATVYFKILIALMTRNAIVISPHPAAKACCVDAVHFLSDVAELAGAPKGIIQVVESPTLAVVVQFMNAEKTDLILATGGNAMVRAAYSSANPAIGVGPGNVPVLVDDSADMKMAANHIVESKSFDNSVLCTNESVLFVIGTVKERLSRALESRGAYICSEEDTQALRRLLFHPQGFNIEMLGRDAPWIAAQAGIRVPRNTRILVTPIEDIGPDEPLSGEKLCPVLAMFVARSLEQGIANARNMLRFSGAGHSAAIHSQTENSIIAFSQRMPVYRVVVNAPSSQGAAGFETALAPTFTIGTGYYGRSSIGENIGPKHLVHLTQVATQRASALPVDPNASFSFSGPLPEAPSDGVSERKVKSSQPRSHHLVKRLEGKVNQNVSSDSLRDEIRRLIMEELGVVGNAVSSRDGRKR